MKNKSAVTEGSDVKNDFLSSFYDIDLTYTHTLKALKMHLHKITEKFGKDSITIGEIIDELNDAKKTLQNELQKHSVLHTPKEQMQRYHINDEIMIVNNLILRTTNGDLDWF